MEGEGEVRRNPAGAVSVSIGRLKCHDQFAPMELQLRSILVFAPSSSTDRCFAPMNFGFYFNSLEYVPTSLAEHHASGGSSLGLFYHLVFSSDV